MVMKGDTRSLDPVSGVVSTDKAAIFPNSDFGSESYNRQID